MTNEFKPKEDYLKYWRVIRYFMQAKYKISSSDIELLLFLYSEKYFNKSKFYEFDQLISWDRKRFKRLIDDDWIIVFRKKKGKQTTLYEMSYKGRRMIGTMYKKLNGEELPEGKVCNPLFSKDTNYTDKLYRDMIIEMNKFIRQQRHQTP